jgi:hypothetical protein
VGDVGVLGRTSALAPAPRRPVRFAKTPSLGSLAVDRTRQLGVCGGGIWGASIRSEAKPRMKGCPLMITSLLVTSVLAILILLDAAFDGRGPRARRTPPPAK